MYAFQKHQLTPAERLWLEESLSPDFSVRTAKVKLHGQLPRDFQPSDIDPRVYASNRPTPVGLWHLNHDDPILQAMDALLRDVKGRVLANPALAELSALEIAQSTGLSERVIGQAWNDLSHIGAFYDTATLSKDGKAIVNVTFQSDSAYDNYLNYQDLGDLLERFYLRRGKALWGSIAYRQSRAAQILSLDQKRQEAERAVYRAIETAVEHEGRAYVGNVPNDAVALLSNITDGEIGPSEASSLIQDAVSKLVAAAKIAAPEKPHEDWKVLVPSTSEVDALDSQRTRIFIVHGQDDGTKHTVARFLEKLGLEPVILHEQPNRGRTIITKFLEESDRVGFAVVLMTPDDHGKPAHAETWHSRARQNVVFELGYFIGRLQPERVVALVKGQIERPSDFDGVVYIALDKDDWRNLLAKEIRAAGIEFDASKVL